MNRRLLLQVLRNPEHCQQLSLVEWEGLIRAARVTRVWNRLAFLLQQSRLAEHLPREVQRFLRIAARANAARSRQTRWELACLGDAIAQVGCPILLLKGTAYLMGELPCQLGRDSADIDLLVPRTHLGQVEELLLAAGYHWKDLTDRDQRYYREWLHELPPLLHRYRQFEVDVHHAVVPSIDTLHIPTEEILKTSRRLENSPFSILAPADLAIHSAVHLFRNGKYHHAIRDLHDLHLLCTDFSASSSTFWEDLVTRIHQFGVQEPLYLGLISIRDYFATSVPPSVLEKLTPSRMNGPRIAILRQLLDAAMLPDDPDNRSRRRRAAIIALSYYPLPRWRTMCSANFWLKRLGGD